MEASYVKSEHEVLVELLKLTSEFNDMVDDYDYKLPFLNANTYILIKEQIEGAYDLKAQSTNKLYSIISQYERIMKYEY